MTITYSLDVANTRFCGFTKLLLRWKGSIYKILWKELLCFIVGYAILSVTYRCILNENQRRTFEDVSIYCETFVDLIPLSFVLGFYVSLVVGRWWNQYDAIPWPDRTCYKIATYVHGSDERSRMIRRTLGRYLILIQTLTFQAVSTAVKKRFPTTDHIQASGLMTKEEKAIYEKIEVPYGKWWLPAHWFCALAMRARKEGRIKDSILLEGLITEMLAFRSACGTMFNYDWISVPLVYTQVVTLATYTYSIALLMGRQYLDPNQGYKEHQIDLYVPIFTLLQYFFYVGWLKVAEQIVNPYGEDDDDFELNWCLDRSAQVVYVLVDHLHTKHPKLRRDQFWDEFEPQLPHTKLTVNNIKNPQLGSAYDMEINPAETDFLPLETLLEEDSDDHVYSSDTDKRAKSIRSPSILLQMINASLRQSIRRRSTRKGDSFRNPTTNNYNSSIRGHVNPSFGISNEKTAQNSPCLSRSSSVTVKNSPVPGRSSFSKNHSSYVSPSHSRSSSLSFKPTSVGRHRHRMYDLQTEAAILSGVLPDANTGNVTPVSVTPTTLLPTTVNEPPVFPTPQLTPQTPKEDVAPPTDVEQPKVMESYMPPIPEEPSRPGSTPEMEEPPSRDSTNDLDAIQEEQCTEQESLDNVQELVAEASKVLKELNRAVSQRGHRHDCGNRGYESCCSMSSDSTDDETDVEDEFQEARDQLSVIIDMKTESKPDKELPTSDQQQS